MLKRFLVSLALAALASQSDAQSVQASVDRGQVALDSQLLLTVVIEGTQDARPVLPDLPDFRVVPRGGSSREMSIVNGAMTQRISYRFILIPSRVGRFTVGPVSAEIGGRQYQSEPFRVRVLAAGEQPADQAEAFLTVAVSDEQPFVGEQIIYTWRFYRRIRVADARITALDFGDLTSEELGEVREYDTNYQGVPYRVSELRRALFAQRPGEVTIAPSELTCEIAMASNRRSSIFDLGRLTTEPRILRSRQVKLNVRPLPSVPPGFSGLVGDFSIRSSLSKNELRVGESATFEVRVQGSGNIQLMSEPELPNLSAFKIYEDKPSTHINRTGEGLQGTRTFRKALVPLGVGLVDLPPINLVFFDPTREAFRTRSTEGIPIQILPGAEDEDLMLTESLNPGAGKVAVRVLADDILPIRTDLRSVRRAAPSILELATWTSAATGPPVLVGLVWLFGRRRRRFASEQGLRARQGAFRQALASLEQVTNARDVPISTLAANASSVLRGYVGQKLGANGEAMTPAEAEASLVRARVQPDVAKEARETLERLEALAFGGDSRRFTGQQLAQSTGSVIKELEEQLAAGFRVDGRRGRWFGGLRSTRR